MTRERAEQLDGMMRMWIKKTDPGLSPLLEMGWSEAYNDLLETSAPFVCKIRPSGCPAPGERV